MKKYRCWDNQDPQGSHSCVLMTGGGGQSDFFVSEILAKSDFFESMNLKDTRIFWVAKKAEGFFGVVKKGLSDFFLVCL